MTVLRMIFDRVMVRCVLGCCFGVKCGGLNNKCEKNKGGVISGSVEYACVNAFIFKYNGQYETPADASELRAM